jgi:8-oxo-dGTP pyrophosphatase MutT (NUDIX family)
VFETTLCIPIVGQPPERVLLGLKKGGFGAGKLTAFGGKVEPGETLVQAAVRELEEETGMRARESALCRLGELTFIFPNRPSWSQRVHVFTLTSWQNEPGPSQEITPGWFSVSEIPYRRMWQDAATWLPRILAGIPIRAQFTFDEDNDTLARVEFLPWQTTACLPRLSLA